MSNAVLLLPLPDGRWIGLTDEQLVAALALGSSLMPASVAQASAAAVPSRLLSAQEMEAATTVPASWFERQARERRIPAHKLGRYWRFDLAEIAASGAMPRKTTVLRGNGSAGHENR